jgi:hypothetical protein
MTKATFVNFFYRSYQVLLTDVVIKAVSQQKNAFQEE